MPSKPLCSLTFDEVFWAPINSIEFAEKAAEELHQVQWRWQHCRALSFPTSNWTILETSQIVIGAGKHFPNDFVAMFTRHRQSADQRYQQSYTGWMKMKILPWVPNRIVDSYFQPMDTLPIVVLPVIDTA